MKIVAILMILLTICACSESDSTDFIVDGSGDVRYSITLNASWSSSTHPEGFPANAHFSKLVGTTHNFNSIFWQQGDIASSGIEQMAETGKTAILVSEISNDQASGNSDKLILGDGIDSSPGSRNFILPVNASHPYLTLVTMIAPSPDWFIGVSALNLMPNNTWLDNTSVTLYAYDAGTDSGTQYTSANANTNPQDVITQITDSPFLVNTNIVEVGTLTISRIQ